MDGMWSGLVAEPWVSMVRIAGVGLALWGTWVTSPDALRQAARDAKRPLHSLARIWRRVLRRDDTGPEASRASSQLSDLGAVGDALQADRWSTDPARQIEILKHQLGALRSEVGAVKESVRREAHERASDVAQLREEQSAAVAGLRDDITERDRATLRLNARGLPILGAAIVLSGLPDPLVRNAIVAGVLLATSLLLLIWVAIPSRAERQSDVD